MPAIEIAINAMRTPPGRAPEAVLAEFGDDRAADALAFHRSVPGYAPTPLRGLPNLAERLGLSAVWVKDESARLGLGAFKVLGGSYAIATVLSRGLGEGSRTLPWGELASAGALARTGRLLFVTATDGNHGRGVAWSATALGHRALVLMPGGTAAERAENVRATGAECRVTDVGYDETVLLAAREAEALGGILVQDSGAPGDEVPRLITAGYMTLIEEVLGQLADSGPPTHVFLQCGVGSFPAAALGRLAAALGPRAPRGIVVEPKGADCLYRSIARGDGLPEARPGPLVTIMAGLACGVPSPLAWPPIRDLAFAAVRCEDFAASNGMRILASPLPGDPAVVSGESGAVGAGLLELLAGRPANRELAARLELGPESRVLLISTEGATDKEFYRSAVWRGRCPEPPDPGA